MTSRRKFLLQGSMAGTAFLAANPFKTFAGSIAPAAGVSLSTDKVTFIHTGDHKPGSLHQKIRRVSNLAKNTAAVVLLHAGNSTQSNTAYDATMNNNKDFSFFENSYKIFYKGNIKIAVITAQPGDNDIVRRSSTLAEYLKAEKKCQVVICLSRLGYKNENMVDDTRLAMHSSGLDVIISGHRSNCSPYTAVVLNDARHEVIIQPAAPAGFDFGNIEIGFDKSGNKNFIAFNNLNSIQGNV
jgi:predicted phosphodiesterase